MSSRQIRLVVLLAVPLIAAILAVRLPAQQPSGVAPQATEPVARQPAPVAQPRYIAARTPETQAQAIQANTQAALEKYKNAASDDDRTVAGEELRQVVAEHFDLLLKQRDDQLADLQKRLETLTQELQKRRDAKQQIVDLRVEVLLNEANGLGFYPDGDEDAGAGRYWYVPDDMQGVTPSR